MSFAQQRLWFLDQLASDLSAYNMPTAVRLDGPLDVAALARSLEAVVRRHEILRTTFALIDGQPVQVIAPALPGAADLLPIQDLRRLPKAEREAEVQRLANEAAQCPFDLARG